MQQCLGIALGMLLLTVYLQAMPVDRSSLIDDLGFDSLRQHVSCNDSVRFQFPTNQMEHCRLTAAKKAMKLAKSKCVEEQEAITFALAALDYLQLQPASDCNSQENTGSYTFMEFLKAFENDLQESNQNSSS